MIQSQRDLIQRLKHQPRHGMADPKDPVTISWGDIGDAFGALDTLLELTDKLQTSFNKLNNAAARTIGIDSAVTRYRDFAGILQDVANRATYLERRNAALNKSFGITSKAAAKLGKVLDDVANEFSLADGQVRQYASSIKSMFPLFNQTTKSTSEFYRGMIQTQHILQTGLGMSEEAANNFSQFAAQGGNNAIQFVDQLHEMSKAMDESGTMGYFNMMVQDIADAGSEMQLQFGKIPGEFAMAALKAKKFGLGLKQIQATAAKMLDIESSIGAELEYQLLSGRRLVNEVSGESLTNAFRQATVTGDSIKAADTLNQILDQEGDTLEKNLFARQQMAQLLGIEEQQLASALQKRNIIEKAASAGFTIDLDSGKVEAGLAEAQKALKAGALTKEDFGKLVDATDTRTTDDLLKEILNVNERQLFISQATNQEQLIGLARKNMIDITKAFKPAEVPEGTLEIAGKAMVLKKVGTDAIDAFITSMTTIPNAASADTYAADTLPAKDLVAMPGTNGKILSGPFGAFSLDERDMVIAGDPAKLTGGGNSNNNMMQFAAAIVAAINSQTQQLKSRDNTYGSGINDSYYS